jgi:hypothetical protein
MTVPEGKYTSELTALSDNDYRDVFMRISQWAREDEPRKWQLPDRSLMRPVRWRDMFRP